MMKIKNDVIYKCLGVGFFALAMSACTPDLNVNKSVDAACIPEKYHSTQDTSNVAKLSWKEYFSDSNLIALIDTALQNNQELNIMLQEIEISRNEVMARKGEYLPSIGLQAGAEIDRVGRYTRNGALEANNEIKPGRDFPEPFSDYMIGAVATWEIDVWRKLRNAKKSRIYALSVFCGG